MAKKTPTKSRASNVRPREDKQVKPRVYGKMDNVSVPESTFENSSDTSTPTLNNKPKTLAEYMADKGRALREHVGLPPMPALKPCNAPSDEDICTLAMCYCTPKEIKDIGSDDWMTSSRAISKAMLKRKMLERALSGDSQMMVWLSKQHLGYREPKSDEQEKTTINIVTSDMPEVLHDKVIEVKE